MNVPRRLMRIQPLLAILLMLSVDAGAESDILIGRLSGPNQGTYLVSETVLEWLQSVVADSCGLSVELYGDVVDDDGFAAFNEEAISRGAVAMMTGSYRIEGDYLQINMVLDQIFTNRYLLIDREHFSRSDQGMTVALEELGAGSPVPEYMLFQGYLLASFVHGRQEMFDTALTEVDLALEYSSGVPAEAVAEAYLFRSQLVAMTGQDYMAGMSDLETALEIDPRCIRALIARGYRFELVGDTESALEQYDLAIESAPYMYKCWKCRANLYSNQNMFEESVEDYCMAVELNPGDFESWHYGGVDLRRMRDFGRAYEWLGCALELEPENAQVWYDRALVNAISELDLEKATEDMEMALELNPLDWEWYDTAATLWIMRDEWEECIEMANRGLEVSPREPQLLVDRAVGYMMLMDFDLAVADLDEALEEGASRGTNFREGTYTLTEALRAVSAMSPDSPEYWLYLGYAYGEGGYLEEAIEPLSKAIEMNRSLRDAYWLRAANYADLGIIVPALADMEKALELTTDPAERVVLQQEIDRISNTAI